MQKRLFRGAIDWLTVIGEPINQVLEVWLDGDEIIIRLYDLPSGF